jgi:hypothetical protein
MGVWTRKKPRGPAGLAASVWKGTGRGRSGVGGEEETGTGVSLGAFVEVARGPGCALGLQLLVFATLAQPKSLARTNFKAPKARPQRNANFLRFFSARLVAAFVRSLR